MSSDNTKRTKRNTAKEPIAQTGSSDYHFDRTETSSGGSSGPRQQVGPDHPYYQVLNYVTEATLPRPQLIKSIFFGLWPVVAQAGIAAAAAMRTIYGTNNEDIIAVWLCGFVEGRTEEDLYPETVFAAWEMALAALPYLADSDLEDQQDTL